MFLKHLRIAIISLILFTVLTGMLYPLAVTEISQIVFPEKANGSLIKKDGKVLGSELIGQSFPTRNISGAGFPRPEVMRTMQAHLPAQTWDR